MDNSRKNRTRHSKHIAQSKLTDFTEKRASSYQPNFESYIALISILLGIFIIGLNNQTSVVFLLPFLVLTLLDLMPKLHFTKGISARLILFALLNLQSDFKDYAMRISKYAGAYPWQTKIYHILP